MAITGSILEAENAGIIPESTPIKSDTPIPNIIFSRESVMTNVSVEKNESKLTSNKPVAPPKKLKKMASNKNCSRIK